MEMTALLREWKESDGQGHHFISDGIIDAEKWHRAPRKVLFLLKEAYDEDKDAADWDLCELIRDEWGRAKHKVWRTAAYWAYGLHYYTPEYIPKILSNEQGYEKCREIASEALLGSAVVNIKKSDGKLSSDMEEIGDHAKLHRTRLWQQIDLINPDIIICGNTWETIHNLWETPVQRYDCIWEIQGRLFVDCYHPANRYPHMLNYYSLMGLVHGARLFQ